MSLQRGMMSLRSGTVLTDFEKDDLTSRLFRTLTNKIQEGASAEEKSIEDRVENVIEDVSNGDPVVRVIHSLGQRHCSLETTQIVGRTVDDFLMELHAQDSSRVASLSLVATSRLYQRLVTSDIDLDDWSDLEEYEELEISGGIEALKRSTWKQFVSIFDHFFSSGNKNNVLWISDVFVSSNMTMTFYGDYDMKFPNLNGTYSVFAADGRKANEIFEVLFLLLSRDNTEEVVQINGFDEEIEDLSVDAAILRELWNRYSKTDRRLEFYALNFSEPQVRALLEIDEWHAKSLCLTTCFFQDGGWTFLKLLRQNKSPASLHLSNDFPFSMERIHLFAKAIQENTRLQELDVWGDAQSDSDTTSTFLSGLRDNRELRSLRIGSGWKWDDDQHWPLFCDVLSSHPRLQKVELGCGEGGAGHVRDLEHAVLANGNLVDIKICLDDLGRLRFNLRVKPLLLLNFYRPYFEDVSRRRPADAAYCLALFGHALSAVSCKRYSTDLLFYVLKKNSREISFRPRNAAPR